MKRDGDGEGDGVVCLFWIEKFKNNRLIIIIIMFLFMFVLKQVHFHCFDELNIQTWCICVSFCDSKFTNIKGMLGSK